MDSIIDALAVPMATKRVAAVAGIPAATLFSRKKWANAPSGKLTLADALSLMLAERLMSDLGLSTGSAAAIAFLLRSDWSLVVDRFPDPTYLVAWPGNDVPFEVTVLGAAELTELEASGRLPSPPPAGVIKFDLASVWRAAQLRLAGKIMGVTP